MKIYESGSTTQLSDIIWADGGFIQPEAQMLWSGLPECLREVAIAEISEGNKPTSILENRRRGIILLEFSVGPLVELKNQTKLKVHRRHEHGNYCYDGTTSTYEDLESGCFLAFNDAECKDEI